MCKNILEEIIIIAHFINFSLITYPKDRFDDKEQGGIRLTSLLFSGCEYLSEDEFSRCFVKVFLSFFWILKFFWQSIDFSQR